LAQEKENARRSYVRMSSDRQELSIGSQSTAIHAYAEAHHMEVVRLYEDAAKSGLQIVMHREISSAHCAAARALILSGDTTNCPLLQ
jgi:DNA invertase Pin-like site-specific DNA recombinase